MRNATSSNEADRDAVLRATRRLEMAALTPIRSREFPRWYSSVCGAARKLSKTWQARLEMPRSHAREIATSKRSIRERVVASATRARALRERLDRLLKRLRGLREAARNTSPEAALEHLSVDEIWELRNELVYVSVHLRAVDAELAEWLRATGVDA